jgi:precorrin-6Y C5,15-methyltransferase (decarboxylating)
MRMLGDPWLTIVGMPDDTAATLPPASLAAIRQADVIFGGPRHLELVDAGARGQAWPVPFSVDPVLALKGRRVVVLASGDPFWFGAGGSISRHLAREEYAVLPSPSVFSLVAAALGWRLEEITCHGLHAAPIARLRGVLAPHRRLICLVRDGAAPAELAAWLAAQGGGAAVMHVCERMGGAQQRIRSTTAGGFDVAGIVAPVAVAVELPGDVGISRASGLPDDVFHHDGQITKRPVRALTLSALAPRPGEQLWDLGAGSGSISVEWCLTGGRASAVELQSTRVANIARNIDDFGISHLMTVTQGTSLACLDGLPTPNAVFIGGGGDVALFDALFSRLPKGTRLVANGVTLETEVLLAQLHAAKGGTLLRIELAQADPLGRMRGWKPVRPVVQWSVTL